MPGVKRRTQTDARKKALQASYTPRKWLIDKAATFEYSGNHQSEPTTACYEEFRGDETLVVRCGGQADELNESEAPSAMRSVSGQECRLLYAPV